MLYRILHAFETATGPISLDELSHTLGIERSALDGMITFWVRKGRLRESGGGCMQIEPGCTCSSHPNGCVFASTTSRTIDLVRREG